MKKILLSLSALSLSSGAFALELNKNCIKVISDAVRLQQKFIPTREIGVRLQDKSTGMFEANWMNSRDQDYYYFVRGIAHNQGDTCVVDSMDKVPSRELE